MDVHHLELKCLLMLWSKFFLIFCGSFVSRYGNLFNTKLCCVELYKLVDSCHVSLSVSNL